MGWFSSRREDKKEIRRLKRENKKQEADCKILMSEALRRGSSTGGRYMAERKEFLKNKRNKNK